MAIARATDVDGRAEQTRPGAASAAYMDWGDRFGDPSRDAIPLGHKIALRDWASTTPNVREYGVLIGSPGPRRGGEWSTHTT